MSRSFAPHPSGCIGSPPSEGVMAASVLCSSMSTLEMQMSSLSSTAHGWAIRGDQAHRASAARGWATR
eukprot:14377058-Heterocapsa_arctica.AAC.1